MDSNGFCRVIGKYNKNLIKLVFHIHVFVFTKLIFSSLVYATEVVYQYDAMGNLITQQSDFSSGNNDTFPEGLIPNGDFEAGNDFIANKAKAQMVIESTNALIGYNSLKATLAGWSGIYYQKIFPWGSTKMTTLHLSGFLKVLGTEGSSTLSVKVTAYYESGSITKQELVKTIDTALTDRIPLSLTLDLDNNRTVNRVYFNVIHTDSGSVELLLDNAQLRIDYKGENETNDLDSDGIDDSWELEHFGNLNHDMSQDSDTDGLSDEEEYIAGTNPTLVDSDGDGINDGFEFNNGMDPTDVSDVGQDTDNDGLPDAFEIYHGLNINDATDALTDSDGDGYTVFQEFMAATSDNDANEYSPAFADFETGSIEPLYWLHSGDMPWQIDDEQVLSGSYSLRSGAIIHDERSIISTTVYASGKPMSFELKVSSGDEFLFYIDGIEQGLWYGEIEKTRVSFPLSKGKHTLKWLYTKDSIDVEGEDRAWIDNLYIPVVIDSDNDSVDDSWEYLYFDDLDHNMSLDSDNDGLSDIAEYNLLTNPRSLDSDGDGMNDGWEVSKGLEPAIKDDGGDVDLNGLTNLTEFIQETPNYSGTRDGDSDGLTDLFEVNNGMNPSDETDALLDTDNDGFSVWQEFKAGTSDNDELSSPSGTLLGFEGGNAGPIEGISSQPSSWVFDDFRPFEGLSSLRSGDITHNELSVLETTINATGEALSFDLKVSTQERYDLFKFYVDDVLQQEWSGELAFHRVEFPVSAGTRHLKWVYEKDDAYSEGGDFVWIDNLFLPTTPDSDEDGILDAWEIEYFGGLNHDMSLDTDGDGLSDLEEYHSGTNPLIVNETSEEIFPLGLIPNGDFEAGNDFVANKVKAQMSIESISALIGDSSLKVTLSGWSSIYFHKGFPWASTAMSRLRLSGVLKVLGVTGKSTLRVKVFAYYERGDAVKQELTQTIDTTFIGRIPLSLDLQLDNTRKVNRVYFYITHADSGSVEILLDNAQLQVEQ